MKLRRRTYAPLLLAATALLACMAGPAEFPAADFTLKSPVSGKTISFSEFRGRPVVIYWFTSW